jgi:hypothetical protein
MAVINPNATAPIGEPQPPVDVTASYTGPIEVAIWGGPQGPQGDTGEPGAGIQIKGVATTWPPAAAPAEGDLWIMPNPVPAGAPAGFDPGDGAAWSGTEWVNTGPIKGEDGIDGPPTVVVSVTPPAPPTVDGFLWVDPNGDGSAGIITNAPFDEANPIDYATPPVTQQSNGQPIGVSPDGQQIFRPLIIGAVPVVVGGKRYLLPIIEE